LAFVEYNSSFNQSLRVKVMPRKPQNGGDWLAKKSTKIEKRNLMFFSLDYFFLSK